MSDKEYKVAGYSFSDAYEYKEAKKEAETIEYIRANTDLKDINKTVKLYHKLVERKTLRTVVGFAFLKELQQRIVEEGIINKENLPCIRIDKDKKQVKIYAGALDHEQEKKHLEILNNYKIRIRNLRIVIGFLAGIILAMLLISIFSDRSNFINYENKIVNKYSAWEENLDAREKALKEKEELQSVD
jgi:hypothetical protein